MLASQWSREELTRFYKAYRKHGQIWKKVARAIRTKSPEMAENLYNVNKAFLSLPEDQGTADAFLAMMADRRNFLDICDNEQVNTAAPMKTRKPKKCSCGKSRLGIIKDSDRPYRTNWQKSSNPSCHGRISNPKRKHFEDKMEGFIQHPVKKRTPRVPIHHFYDTNVKHAILSPTEELSRVEVKYAVGVQAVRQPLAGTSQNGGSPPPLGSLSSRTYIRRSSYVQEKCVELDLGKANYMDVNCLDASLGNGEARDSGSVRDARRLNSEMSGLNEPTTSGSEFEKDKNGIEACGGIVEGECFSLDYLHMLADAALTLLAPTAAEFEPSVHVVEQNSNLGTADKPNVPRSASVNRKNDCSRRSGTQGKASSTEKIESSDEMPQDSPMNFKILRKKRKFFKTEVLGENGKASCVRQRIKLPKRECLDRSIECTSLNTNPGSNNMDPAMLTSSISSSLTANTRRKRKMGLQKAIVQKELQTSINFGDDCLNKDSSVPYNKADLIKRQISNCLRSDKLRRWCMFEWFYSAIDYPWFAKSEFVNYLNHARLGQVARLCRAEWSIIRSSLGKPRRFSKKFLLEERKKLEQYRESVRTCYAEVRSGARDGLPSDLAQPFSVGQHVITCNPKSGDINDGSILMVDHNRLKVLFTNSDLEAQFVMDVDSMPLNPSKNWPVDFRNQNVRVDELCNNYTDMNHLVTSSEYSLATLSNHIKNQIKDTDSRALLEMSSSLDKKELLVTELAYLNEVLRGMSGNIGDFEQFKRQYAMIFSQLSDVNQQVNAGRYYLTERNTYDENSRAHWFSSAEPSAPDSTFDLVQAVEIVERSKYEARTMVASTILTGEKEDVDSKIGDALDSTKHQHSGPSSQTLDSSCICPQSSSPFQPPIVHSPGEQVVISSKTKELISGCLATCLMIQTCANEQHPPSVIEETLRQALSSLKPCCPENLPIYEEIERCMTDIKYDMIKRVPTRISKISV